MSSNFIEIMRRIGELFYAINSDITDTLLRQRYGFGRLFEGFQVVTSVRQFCEVKILPPRPTRATLTIQPLEHYVGFYWDPQTCEYVEEKPQ